MTCTQTAWRTGPLIALAVALVTSACAPRSELQIDMAPEGALTERQYGSVADDHPEATALVRQALEDRGGIFMDGGWRVQTTLAVRPAGVGAFADAPARDGRWSAGPRVTGARRGSMLHVLSVVLERADGTQHRVVQVSARSDDAQTSTELLLQLTQAAADAVYEGAQTGPLQAS